MQQTLLWKSYESRRRSAKADFEYRDTHKVRVANRFRGGDAAKLDKVNQKELDTYFKNLVAEVGKGRYKVLGHYISSQTPVTLQCLECGTIFGSAPSFFDKTAEDSYGKCPQCFPRKNAKYGQDDDPYTRKTIKRYQAYQKAKKHIAQGKATPTEVKLVRDFTKLPDKVIKRKVSLDR